MATSTLTIKTNSNPYHPYTTNAQLLSRNPTGRSYGMLLPIPLLALWGMFLLRAWQKGCYGGKRMYSPAVSFGILVAASLLLLGASGCYKSKMSGTLRGPATVMITGTSGSLVHSTSVSLTVQ
jgi:hypothetical protein